MQTSSVHHKYMLCKYVHVETLVVVVVCIESTKFVVAKCEFGSILLTWAYWKPIMGSCYDSDINVSNSSYCKEKVFANISFVLFYIYFQFSRSLKLLLLFFARFHFHFHSCVHAWNFSINYFCIRIVRHTISAKQFDFPYVFLLVFFFAVCKCVRVIKITWYFNKAPTRLVELLSSDSRNIESSINANADVIHTAICAIVVFAVVVNGCGWFAQTENYLKNVVCKELG